VALLGLGTFVRAAAKEDKTDPYLRSVLDGAAGQADENVPVIVHFAERAPLTSFPGRTDRADARRELVEALREVAERSQRPARSFLGGEGITRTVSLWLTNSMALSAPPALIERLAERPEVERVVLDRVITQPAAVHLSATRQDRDPAARILATPEWNVDMVRAPLLWTLGLDGTGTVVASLDSGVDAAHQDLAGNWRGGANSWFDPSGEHATPYDKTGHGTQGMGLMVGGSLGGTAIGVAPGAQWIAVKIFNDAGSASFSAIHQGFQWVLDPDGDPQTDDAADVVNNSWGLRDNVDECILEFQADVQALKAAGIAVVFSAGNEGPAASTSLSPANNPEGFAVGALDETYTVGGFSSRGPSTCDGDVFPEVTAPGYGVWTADLTFGGVFPDSYTYADGTSFAAPHVAGTMALLVQAFPTAAVEEIEAALLQSAYDLGAAGPDNDYGHGLIDALAAHDLLDSAGGCTDADGDLRYVESACAPVPDCDDGDDRIWRTPGEVPLLTFDDAQTLSWTEPLDPGGATSSLRYDTLRSADPADFVSAATCVESNDGADRTATDTQRPDPGQVFYYLIRAENDCPSGSGSLGTGSQVTGRAGAECL